MIYTSIHLVFSFFIKFSFVLGLALPLLAETSEEIVRVMSYNIHRGGVVFFKQPLSQTAKVIQAAKTDIVGIQETRSPRGDTLKDLAKLLGWNHDEGGGIVTRYEIVEHFKGGKDYKGGIKVKLASDKRNPKRLIQTNLRKSIGITLEASAILKPLTAARCPMEPRIPITKSQK
mgnify:CR=1 FL=1